MDMVISKIEKQKKFKGYYNIFVNDEFLIGITEETLIHYNLNKGVNIDEKTLEAIKEADTYSRGLHYAIRALGRRSLLKSELKKKMKTKGYDDHVIHKTVQRLEDKKYLNDKTYIQSFVKDQKKLKHAGPKLIEQKLLVKGAAIELIKECIENHYPISEQYHNADYWLDKLFNKNLNHMDEKLTLKFKNTLLRKGFSWEVIQETFNKINR
jgi:regulatory protein